MEQASLETILDEYVRPLLHAHGGDLEVIDVTDGILQFRFLGQCSGCAAADLTTEDLVQTVVQEHLPQIKRAVLVQDVSEELLDQARTLLRGRQHG